MRVLHVAQPTDGGVAAYVVAAAVDQLARGWEVAVACPGDSKLAADLATLGIRHERWEAVRSPGPSAFGEARRLGRIVARYRPDAVHLHASKAGLAGRLHLRRRLPTLFQPHGWSWLAVNGGMRKASIAWERVATRWTSLFVCVGEGEASQGHAAGLRAKQTVIRNGVDLRRFRPADDVARAVARAEVGVGPDTPLAVCVGRVTRQKGQDVLLSAWQSVHGAELAIVGDGDLLPSLRALDVPGVRFVGAVDDVRVWLAAADLVVLPSRWEGLPLTALEALATGRPVVASDVPGLAEVITPSVGQLVPVERPTELAGALSRRLGDPALRRRESEAAADRAAEFDLRRTFDQLAAATVDVATAVPAALPVTNEQRAW